MTSTAPLRLRKAAGGRRGGGAERLAGGGCLRRPAQRGPLSPGRDLHSAHAKERGGPKAHRGAGWWAGCREALGGWSQGRVRADGEDERRGEGREQRRPIVKMER